VTWRVRLVGLAIALLALFIWRAQLFVVSRPGDRPRALALIAEPARTAVAFDVMLPAVPIGETRFSSGGAVRLVHYWAPWERHAASQAIALDSLLKNEALIGLRGDVVCFDPFPSVMRYVSRLGLRLGIALDRDRRLARVLPCPSLPYTYVLDRRGRIAIAQAGEVDWLAPETREALATLLAEAGAAEPAALNARRPPSRSGAGVRVATRGL